MTNLDLWVRALERQAEKCSRRDRGPGLWRGCCAGQMGKGHRCGRKGGIRGPSSRRRTKWKQEWNRTHATWDPSKYHLQKSASRTHTQTPRHSLTGAGMSCGSLDLLAGPSNWGDCSFSFMLLVMLGHLLLLSSVPV